MFIYTYIYKHECTYIYNLLLCVHVWRFLFWLNYILPNNMYFLLYLNPLKILQSRKQWKTRGNAMHDLSNSGRSSSSSRSNPWERVWAAFEPLRKGMNSPNDCFLSVSGPLGKGNLFLDPWERVWTVQLMVCFLFLCHWERGIWFWTLGKGYEQFNWLFAFCFPCVFH